MADKNFRVKHGLEVGNNATTHATINSTSFVFTGNTITLTGNVDITGTGSITGNFGIGNTTPAVKLHITGTDAIFLPVGNTAQRPSAANGMLRYNNEDNRFEGYANSSWGPLTASGGYYRGNDGDVGEVTSVQNLFRINSNTMTTNTTFVAGENAAMTGPLVISSGINLTLETGARIIIL